MTVYTSLFGGPRKPGEKDGPQEFHLVLLDNGRSGILAGEYRESLRCIRCGACLSVCPVYGMTVGSEHSVVYPGPIGALRTPLVQGLGKFKNLPQMSTLCGACYEVCPVKINIPQHLINLRREIVAQAISSPIERATYRLWAWMLKSRRRYGILSTWQKWKLRRQSEASMSVPAKMSFHQIWRRRGKGK